MGLPGFRSLVRGVSNHGAAHPSRRALRDACVSGERICLRPPQRFLTYKDESDKQPSSVLPIHCEHRLCASIDSAELVFESRRMALQNSPLFGKTILAG